MTCTIEQDVIVPVSSALHDGQSIDVRFVSFAHLKDGKEHVAVIYGQPDSVEPLVRIHSECLTGDIFASKRCDCGAQLHHAKTIFEHNGGIILYMRQEGRGIGLYQKLKAYALQIKGHDTFEANTILGHEEDERDFTVAADMLNALGYQSCHLLSNNPEKSDALKKCGIDVVKTIQMPSFQTEENKHYIAAKIKRGHTHAA